MGRNKVARYVVAPAITDGQPAFRSAATSDGFRLLAPATISRAPSAGIAMNPTSVGTTTTITAIHSPAKMEAHLVTAPEITLIAVPLSDPPTGKPRNRPHA